MMGEEGANSEVEARILELESAAETLRNLYNRIVQQAGEMNRVEAQPSIAPDARVLMRATPPCRPKSRRSGC